MTPPSLSYLPPVNLQNVVVSIDANGDIEQVELRGDTASTTMVQDGTGDWVGAIPVPPCASSAAYRVVVTHASRPLGRVETTTFPPTGSFVRPVEGLPLACSEPPAPDGQTFVVLRTEDFVDNAPGDGRCEGNAPDDTVACSLRAAVMEANATPGHDIIELSNNRYRLTLEGEETQELPTAAVGDLDITDSVTIRGPDNDEVLLYDVLDSVQPGLLTDDPDTDETFTKVDAQAVDDRLFQVVGAQTALHLDGVVLLNGTAEEGGAVWNEGATVLSRTALVGHRAEDGGAMFNLGTLTTVDVAFLHNRADRGAGVVNRGTAALDRTLFAFQTGVVGSAVHNRGTLAVQNTTATAMVSTDSIFESTGSEHRMDLAYVTVALLSLTPDGAVLRNDAADPSHVTLHSVLIGEVDGASCAGPLESYGGNVIESPCDVSGAALAPDHLGVGTIGTIGTLGSHGGFVPLVHVVPPPTDEWFDPRDLGVPSVVPHTDGRGRPRPVDGNADGTLAPDPGAYEYAP